MIHYLSHPITTGPLSEELNRARALLISTKLQRINPLTYIINPSSTVIPTWEHADYMALWLRTLKTIIHLGGSVYFSHDWNQSEGCKQEHQYALNNGAHIIYLLEGYELTKD